jgi:DNA-binding PadR family transcriptional regulator
MSELLGTFEQVVLLAVIHSGEEAYGRAVLREVDEAVPGNVSAGAVYTTLDRLEAKGMLASRLSDGTAERGGRRRRFYRVTGTGKAALREARTTLESLWKGCAWTLMLDEEGMYA